MKTTTHPSNSVQILPNAQQQGTTSSILQYYKHKIHQLKTSNDLTKNTSVQLRTDAGVTGTDVPNRPGDKFTGDVYGDDTSHGDYVAGKAVYSTNTTLAASRSLADILHKKYSTGHMIGVAFAGNVAISSISGSAAGNKKFENASTAIRLTPVGESEVDFSKYIPQEKLDTLPEDVANTVKDEMSKGRSCAAPKLIGHIIDNRLKGPYYMSEVWAHGKDEGGGYDHGELVQSCETCIPLLPFLTEMLDFGNEDESIKTPYDAMVEEKQDALKVRAAKLKAEKETFVEEIDLLMDPDSNTSLFYWVGEGHIDVENALWKVKKTIEETIKGHAKVKIGKKPQEEYNSLFSSDEIKQMLVNHFKSGGFVINWEHLNEENRDIDEVIEHIKAFEVPDTVTVNITKHKDLETWAEENNVTLS